MCVCVCVYMYMYMYMYTYRCTNIEHDLTNNEVAKDQARHLAGGRSKVDIIIIVIHIHILHEYLVMYMSVYIL